MSSVTLEDIAQQIRNLSDRVGHIETSISELRLEVKAVGDRLDAEVQRWDERFFQLSKDTLSFVRNVITAGVFVAILVPAVKDLVPAILDFFK